MAAATLDLWLVRHGETTASASRQVAGWLDPPLTPRGEEQARAVGAALDGEAFTRVWSSDLRRAVDSSRLALEAAGRGALEVTADSRLRELKFGPYEGQSYNVFDGRFGDLVRTFRDFEIPGGESWDEFRSRIRGFVGELEAGRHLLFVHGGVIRVLTQDCGLDRFVATGSVVGVNPVADRLLFVREPQE